MPKILLKLRDVPDDEIEEVSALMDEHAIAIYRTPPGPFGITAGGLWLRDAEDDAKARALLDDYQAARRDRARTELARARAEGRAETIWTLARRNPLRTLVHLLLAIFILMVFFAPLLELS